MSRDQAADATRWARVRADWRTLPRSTLPLAFTYLKEVLSAEEYERMVREYQDGHREVRIENGFIVTCLTPYRRANAAI
jgi:hypothetical protein